MQLDTLKYFNQANEYWKQNNYDTADNCSVINHKDKGWMCIRETSEDNHVHLSRFVVDEKRTGVGTKMINILKDGYTSISAWVKPDLFPFYINNGFEVQYDSVNEYGYYYLTYDRLSR